MKQHRYKSYQQYVIAQRKGFEKKKDRVWARRENIEAIANMLAGSKTGICHGVRGGQEVDWFRDILGAQVIGTEIGDSEHVHTVQWDFNQPSDRWSSAFDFVYSNAFDHAYQPSETLRVWWGQLKPGGRLVIETDQRNEHTGEISKPVNAIDPTGMTLFELQDLIAIVTKVPVDTVELPVVTFGYRVAVTAVKR